MIELEDLRVGFPDGAAGWNNRVDGVALSLQRGERVGLVGETGSGKSLLALACLGLVPEPGRVTAGSVKVGGIDLAEMREPDLQRLRGGGIGLVLQEAAEALNPVFTIGFQVAETIAAHQGLGRKEAVREALTLLSDVALDAPQEIAAAYPHELSGGQAQRVMLALALAGRPSTLIADEPTSALDTLTQSQVIELIDRLVTGNEMGLLLISHDLVVIESMVDRVVVLFAGRVVEEGPTRDIFASPMHPYTRALLDAAPGRRRGVKTASQRHLPSGGNIPAGGCRFASRCELVDSACRQREPDLTRVDSGRRVRCPVVMSEDREPRGRN